MKFTLSWLQEFLDFNEPLDKILDTLTFAGLEVEEVQDLGAKLAGFTVAGKLQISPNILMLTN